MAGILLDTQTLVDYLTQRTCLAAETVRRIEWALEREQLFLSVVSLLQLQEMFSEGTLEVSAIHDLERAIADCGVGLCPIDADVLRELHGVAKEQTTADRLLAASARAKHLDLISDNMGLRSTPSLNVIPSRGPSLFVMKTTGASVVADNIPVGSAGGSQNNTPEQS